MQNQLIFQRIKLKVWLVVSFLASGFLFAGTNALAADIMLKCVPTSGSSMAYVVEITLEPLAMWVDGIRYDNPSIDGSEIIAERTTGTSGQVVSVNRVTLESRKLPWRISASKLVDTQAQCAKANNQF